MRQRMPLDHTTAHPLSPSAADIRQWCRACGAQDQADGLTTQTLHTEWCTQANKPQSRAK